MRRFHAVVCLLALLAMPQVAGAAKPISVFAYRPTQMEIGKKAVEYHIEKWEAEAKQQGLTLRQYAKQVLQPKFEKLELSTIIDPQGRYRNTDAHHRITALRIVSRLTGVRFTITPKVVANYRGKSFDEYAHHLVETLHKGQFTRAAQALSIPDRVRSLPADYPQLRNNPMRSALELVFEKTGISGSWMNDYVEFRAAWRLIELGLLRKLKEKKIIPSGARSLPAKMATDPRVLAVIAHRLGKPKMQRWLLDEARDKKHRKLLAEKLDSLE